MKRKDLEKRLRQLGWFLKREGGSHAVWTDGEFIEYVPRHAEINEMTAKKILKTAMAAKGSKR